MGKTAQRIGQHTVSNKWKNQKPEHEKRKNRTEFSEQIIRLFVCVLLFAIVFVGRGIFPEGMIRVRNQMLTLLTSNTDFSTVFHQLGESIRGEKNILQQANDLYREVLGIDSAEDEHGAIPQLTSLWSEERGFLNSTPALGARTSHYTHNPYIQFLGYCEETNGQDTEDMGVEEKTVPAAGTVLIHVDSDGQKLPEGYTMDQISLGELDTYPPLNGKINSGYGYRDHPIDGRYQFHGGVDIGGQRGDAIGAFASGTVEYVGEDQSYGLYLQLDHGNGVKSFYAHCDSICVQKGQQVSKGEKIGEVGSSGSATGPHLHLELKYENIHLNPSYYIECLSSQ